MKPSMWQYEYLKLCFMIRIFRKICHVGHCRGSDLLLECVNFINKFWHLKKNILMRISSYAICDPGSHSENLCIHARRSIKWGLNGVQKLLFRPGMSANLEVYSIKGHFTKV